VFKTIIGKERSVLKGYLDENWYQEEKNTKKKTIQRIKKNAIINNRLLGKIMTRIIENRQKQKVRLKTIRNKFVERGKKRERGEGKN